MKYGIHTAIQTDREIKPHSHFAEVRRTGFKMAKKKATGRQGWWFAEVDGLALPCLHKYWLKGLDYHDPFLRHEGKGLEAKIKEAVDAMMVGKLVVLTTDKATLDRDGNVTAFERTGYVAIFEVDDVTYTHADGLRLRLVKRVANLI